MTEPDPVANPPEPPLPKSQADEDGERFRWDDPADLEIDDEHAAAREMGEES